MATESLVSSANMVATPTAGLAPMPGLAVYTRAGFYIQDRAGLRGIYVTKADELGAPQKALKFPLTRDDANDLACELIKLST